MNTPSPQSPMLSKEERERISAETTRLDAQPLDLLCTSDRAHRAYSNHWNLYGPRLLASDAAREERVAELERQHNEFCAMLAIDDAPAETLRGVVLEFQEVLTATYRENADLRAGRDAKAEDFRTLDTAVLKTLCWTNDKRKPADLPEGWEWEPHLTDGAIRLANSADVTRAVIRFSETSDPGERWQWVAYEIKESPQAGTWGILQGKSKVGARPDVELAKSAALTAALALDGKGGAAADGKGKGGGENA